MVVVVVNKHMCVLLLCLMKKNRISTAEKETRKTGIVPFALKEMKCVVVLMSSRPECHNYEAITKVPGMCLIVHGFMKQQEINYQLTSVKRDNLIIPSQLLIPAVIFVAYLEPALI